MILPRRSLSVVKVRVAVVLCLRGQLEADESAALRVRQPLARRGQVAAVVAAAAAVVAAAAVQQCRVERLHPRLCTVQLW